MAKRITESTLRRARSQGVPYLGVVPGLYLYLHEQRNTFRMHFREPESGKARNLTLGVHDFKEQEGRLTEAGALQIFAEKKRQLERGVNPIAEVRREAERKRAAEAGTVPKAMRLFLTRDQRKNRGFKSTAAMLGFKLDKDKLEDIPVKGSPADRWGHLHINALGRSHINDLLDEILDRDAPQMARVMFRCLRRMFNFLVERGVLEQSPMRGMREPAEAVVRDRVLTDEEISSAWSRSAELGYPFEPMFKLMLITGQRRDEVAGMRYSELKEGVWTLPASRTKNKREHVVPLPKLALDIIEDVKSPSSEFMFSTTGKTAASGFSRAKHKLDGLMRQDLPKLEPWRLHDLRRTAASGMARVGVNLPIIEKTLNHVSGSFAGIVGVYQRHSFHEEKRHGLEAWSKFLVTLVTPTPDNVVALLVQGAKRRVPVARGTRKRSSR